MGRASSSPAWVVPSSGAMKRKNQQAKTDEYFKSKQYGCVAESGDCRCQTGDGGRDHAALPEGGASAQKRRQPVHRGGYCRTKRADQETAIHPQCAGIGRGDDGG